MYWPIIGSIHHTYVHCSISNVQLIATGTMYVATKQSWVGRPWTGQYSQCTMWPVCFHSTLTVYNITQYSKVVKTRSLSTARELREHPERQTWDATNVFLFNNNFTPFSMRPPLEAQLRMPCYTVLRIILQASTKSKLRATHIHHGQVSNIIMDISNTGKRTMHNNTYRQAHIIC